ncbi:MAG: ABC transporter permease [Deltaproteobacteria bacterium]|nr:ABC transporter permease [Deltaproteobacteria bacterium]
MRSWVLELWKYRELVMNLTRTYLLIKYRGSLLGFLWSLLNPLLMIAILSLAMRRIMNIEVENYPFFLLVGLLPWNFFVTSVQSSTACVISNGGLLQKVYFPREVFPLSTVAFFFVQFLLATVVFGPFCLFWKNSFPWFTALYPVLVILFLLFTLGVSLAVSAITVFYRDLQHFTEVALTAVFWLSPIVYFFEMIPEQHRFWFKLNPIVLYLTAFHDIIYWERLPGTHTMIAVAAWPFVALLAGVLIFRRLSPRFAEEI